MAKGLAGVAKREGSENETVLSGLYFEDHEELAREASRRLRRTVPARAVHQLLVHSPPYDGYDLHDVLQAFGWKPKPKKSLRERLLRLADEARTSLSPRVSPENVRLLNKSVDDAIGRFADILLPQLSEAERREAYNAVLSGLMATNDSWAAWERVFADLSSRFADKVEAAFMSRKRRIVTSFRKVCAAWKARMDSVAVHDRCWREARGIARQLANRARRKDRQWRQIYLEELVFNYLWSGTPITEDDLAYRLETMTDAAVAARRALNDALQHLPVPREFEQVIAAAYRLLGGAGSRYDRDYQRFRRLVYRNTDPWEREQFKTMEFEPFMIFVGGRWKPYSHEEVIRFASEARASQVAPA